jgi:hypothetical protein
VGLAFAAILLVMTVSLVRQRTAPLAASTVNLVDFRPAEDFNVRVIRGSL